MITIKAELTGISTLADGTIKVVLGTQEVTPEMAGELFGLRKKLLTVGLAENELEPHEIKLLQESKMSIDDVPNGKSPSQRLRSVLYIYWTQNNTGFKEFNPFYEDYINKRIETIKSKLEP